MPLIGSRARDVETASLRPGRSDRPPLGLRSAELGQAGPSQVGAPSLGQLPEQALVDRDGGLLLSGQLVAPCETQDEVLIEKVLGRQTLER